MKYILIQIYLDLTRGLLGLEMLIWGLGFSHLPGDWNNGSESEKPHFQTSSIFNNL